MPTNQDKQTFYQYVLNTMSAADFNTLPSQLGVSQRMVTVRLMNPRKMDLKMIQQLAKLLKVSVKYLIEEFEAGDNVFTVTEYKELTKEKKKATEQQQVPATD